MIEKAHNWRLAVVFLIVGTFGSPIAAPRQAATPEIPIRFRGKTISAVPRGFPNRLLAITIDDGPDPVITPRDLDTLRAHHAHATFFVLGSLATRHPELLRRMVAEGHAIGSHTWSHALHPTREQAETELSRTSEAIRRITGHAPVLFRPPGGSRTSWTARLAQQQGYTTILWTISSADTATKSAEVIANNIIHTPSPGDIALMHDSSTKSATADALPRILEELGRQGWQFVTVPEMLRAWDAWLSRHPAAKSRH